MLHMLPMSAGACETCGKQSKCRLGTNCPDCAEKLYIESWRIKDEEEAARLETPAALTTKPPSPIIAVPGAVTMLPEAPPPLPCSTAARPPNSHATPLTALMESMAHHSRSAQIKMFNSTLAK